jgi:hypothetical protein
MNTAIAATPGNGSWPYTIKIFIRFWGARYIINTSKKGEGDKY